VIRAASLAYPALVLTAPPVAVWCCAPGWADYHGLALVLLSALGLALTALIFGDLKRFYLVLAPLALPALLYAGFVVAFGTVPGEGLWLSIANMNVKEFDALIHLFSGQLVAAFLATFLYLLCTTGKPARLPYVGRRIMAIGAVGAVGAIGLGSLSAPLAASAPAAVERPLWMKSFPFGVAYDFVATAWEDHAAASRPIDLPQVRRARVDEREIYILVIGEATRRDTWQAELPAAPALATERVISFSDALAQAVLTRLSVPMLITGATGSKARRLPHFLHFAKASGCTPVWLTMNDVGTPYAGIAAEYFDNWRVPRGQKIRYDTDMLPLLEQALLRHDKVCVVLHTEGAHNNYVDRYPESFRAHPAGREGPGNALGREDRLAQRAAYRNAVAYSQHFLVQVIAMLERQDARSFLIYAPDHAENLWDDERGRILHGFATRFEFEIPLLMWASKSFVARETDKWAQLRRNKDQPVSNENVLPTLLDAMGITPLPGNSLMRNHVPVDRLVSIDSIEIPFRLVQ
jgi:glucan phosphoethanolaminetransferase (alkaline phosphatase superfamily)